MLEVTGLRWSLTVALLGGLFLLDLLLDRALIRSGNDPSRFRLAAVSSVLHVVLAVGFALLLTVQAGAEAGGQFLAAYEVEKTLSLDNLFVLVLIMNAFTVTGHQLHSVLTTGIVLAIVLRAVFVAAGVVLVKNFTTILLVFGVALIFSAVQFYRYRNVVPDLQRSRLVRLARRVMPVADDDRSGRLTVRLGGRRAATPLLLVLLLVAGTDLLFALDSVPAVFAVTEQPYLVFTATAFALLGLRSLFFVVQGALQRMVYLPAGLAVVLAFTGVKLILHWAHGQVAAIPEISTGLSLTVVTVVLLATGVAGVLRPRPGPGQPGSRHGAGVLTGPGAV